MKQAMLLAAALLAVSTGSALAEPGVYLSWDDCQASLDLGRRQSSTCSSNTEAAKSLYGTYVLPADADALAGNDIELDIMTVSATLPCWWNFTTAPRSAGYQMTFNTVCADNANVGIFDYWSSTPGGPAGGAMAFLQPTAAVPRIRIRAVVAVHAEEVQPVSASVGEIYSFTLKLKFDATVGACAGCDTHACFGLRLIRVTQVGFPFMELTATSPGGWVGWQGHPFECLYDPTVNKTWGAVKALYR
jgi:hypothetical protein